VVPEAHCNTTEVDYLLLRRVNHNNIPEGTTDTLDGVRCREPKLMLSEPFPHYWTAQPMAFKPIFMFKTLQKQARYYLAIKSI